MPDQETIRKHIRRNYAKVAINSAKITDVKRNAENTGNTGSAGNAVNVKNVKNVKPGKSLRSACCAGGGGGGGGGGGCGCSCGGGSALNLDEISRQLGYVDADLASTPAGANMGLGCGNPVAIAALREGETVLDLGSGGGFDCFLARRQVGETGRVIGVDMTPDMVSLARKNAKKSGYDNVEFRLGEIEHLPVADRSVDAIISNCVINLALDKAQVFRDAFRVLKPGGRLSVSDIVATAPIPTRIRKDLALISGCIGGAAHMDEVRNMMEQAGFSDIRITPKDNSRDIVSAWAPGSQAENFIASCIIEAVRP